MSSTFVGALIAVGLGVWAYSDAKALGRRGVKVGNFSPPVWGVGVALLAIVFGVLYLVQRGRAVQAPATPFLATNEHAAGKQSPGPTEDGASERATHVDDRFCGSCGHEIPPYVVSFCPKCGTQL